MCMKLAISEKYDRGGYVNEKPSFYCGKGGTKRHYQSFHKVLWMLAVHNSFQQIENSVF